VTESVCKRASKQMTTITARVPQVDWSKGFARHWNGGNPAVTHAFNAVSFLFPQAEKFFIEVTREVVRNIATDGNLELQEAVKGFVAQESIHSNQHDQYNAILEKQGFDNVVHELIVRLQERSRRDFSPLSRLAIVCGYEHYTAILGNFILSNPRVLKPASPDMALIWGWHSAEETEHKAVCFDLYRAAGGGWLRRVLVFLLVTFNFSVMFGRLYFSLLHRDGCLRPSRLFETFAQSVRFFFGGAGIGWHLVGHGFRYLSPFFHPWNQDNRRKLQAWLATNQLRLQEMGH
jgi:uncharacterized protein